jgi:hypothetical protein
MELPIRCAESAGGDSTPHKMRLTDKGLPTVPQMQIVPLLEAVD